VQEGGQVAAQLHCQFTPLGARENQDVVDQAA
jgi:hypothetical protein